MPRKAGKDPASKSKKTDEALRAGLRLRESRTVLGLSLEGVSARINGKLSASRIGNYEQGIRKLGIREAELLSPAVDQPAAYLIGLITEDERDFLKLPGPQKRALLEVAGKFSSVHSGPPEQQPGADGHKGRDKQPTSEDRPRVERPSPTGLQRTRRSKVAT